MLFRPLSRPHVPPPARATALLFASLLLAGCQGTDDPEAGTAAVTSRDDPAYIEQRRAMSRLPERLEQPVTAGGPVAEGARDAGGEVPDRIVEAVLSDLETRHVLPADELVVERAVEQVFADGSMGCPEPGMRYTMAPINGWQVVVRHGEQAYDYRISSSGVYRLCSGPAL